MNAAELSVVQFPTAGDSFNANSGSTVTISGGEFRLDGLLIDGLGTVGNAVAVNIRVGAQLSGTMADGIPFAFESGDGDRFAPGSLTLQAAAETVPSKFASPRKYGAAKPTISASWLRVL